MKVSVMGKCVFEWFSISMSTVMLMWHLVRATNTLKGLANAYALSDGSEKEI